MLQNSEHVTGISESSPSPKKLHEEEKNEERRTSARQPGIYKDIVAQCNFAGMETNESFSTNNPLITQSYPMFVLAVATIAIIVCPIYLSIILSIVFSPRLRSQSNYFLVSLFVEELACIVTLTILSTVDDSSPQLKHPSVLLTSTTFVTITGYFLNSAVVAADRYFKIARPMQYLRLMSNKVAAWVIIAVWVVIAASIVGLYAALLSDFQDDYILLITILTSQAFFIKVTSVLDLTSLPCLLALIAFVVLLGRTARNQQRRVATEAFNVGSTGVKKNPNLPRPRQKRSSKSTGYIRAYFATIIVAWLPTLVLVNIVTFRIDLARTLSVTFCVVATISLLQMILGALFLTYRQSDHRAVLYDAYKSIIHTLKCC